MKVYTIKMDYSGYLQGGKVNGRVQYWEGDCFIQTLSLIQTLILCYAHIDQLFKISNKSIHKSEKKFVI